MVSAARLGPATAVEVARRQREISVSELFIKNRHLLGFDTPAKALVTAVREAVDNALDRGVHNSESARLNSRTCGRKRCLR